MARKDMTYLQACHAVQSGVHRNQLIGSECGSPKHLRTGINLRAADHTALAKLLIAKGIINEEEYLEAIRQETLLEVERYEKLLSERTGSEVRLE